MALNDHIPGLTQAAADARYVLLVDVTTTPGAGKIPRADGTGKIDIGWIPGGLGYVTSVGLSLPSIFTVSGSPVTGAGTLTGTLVIQNANKVFAGPSSGADATPTFRTLAAADIPASSLSIATTQLTGILQAAQFPALTGDVTTVAGALAATLATVNGNVGTFALANITINAKGLVTAASAPATTGSGNVVLATSPTIMTPTIVDFTNATHSHQNVAGGGTLNAAAIGAGQLALARGGTNVDLSASGGAIFVLAQDASHVISARALVAADIPASSLSIATSQLTGLLLGANFPALTGDVTTPGGSLVTTVALVGGSSAANVHAAELLANAATNVNTASAIVKRDSNGNFLVNNVQKRSKRTNLSAGSLALTVASEYWQSVFGSLSTTFNLTLPDATTLPLGHSFFIENDSNNSLAFVNILDAQSNILVTLAASQSIELYYWASSGGSDGIWSGTSTTGSGAYVLAQNPIVSFKDATTGASGTALVIGHNSTGTPTAAFGADVQFTLQDSTTPDVLAANMRISWAVATHASRSPSWLFTLTDSAGAHDLLLLTPSAVRLPGLTTNGFLKTGSANGTLSVDTSTYLTANQTITLTGDVTGSGATSIAAVVNWPVPGTIGSTTPNTIQATRGGFGVAPDSTMPLIVSAGVIGTAAIAQITNTSANAALGSLQILAPSMGVGQELFMVLGKANTTNNRAYISYIHTADGSTSNRIVHGFLGVAEVFTARADGRFGINQSAPLARFHVEDSTASTTGVATSEVFSLKSTGTPAATFGSSLAFDLADSTTADQGAARLRWFWTTATHASRAANAVLSAFDSTGERDVIGWGANGSAALLGFYSIATAPIAQPANTVALDTLLANLGLRASGGAANFDLVIKPVQAATVSAPAYVKGGMYFDTTLNKMRIGGATAWETVTSV